MKKIFRKLIQRIFEKYRIMLYDELEQSILDNRSFHDEIEDGIYEKIMDMCDKGAIKDSFEIALVSTQKQVFSLENEIDQIKKEIEVMKNRIDLHSSTNWDYMVDISELISRMNKNDEDAEDKNHEDYDDYDDYEGD